MTFTAPYMLWGLFSLLIPLGIHLLSERKSRIKKVGSVKFFRDNEAVKTRSIRLNEGLLLAIRCLFLTLLFLWMAGWQVIPPPSATTVAFIDPAVASHPVVQSALPADATVRYFIPGFPSADETLPDDSSQANHWALAELASEYEADSIIIFSGGQLGHFNGYRPRLPSNIKWVTLNPAMADSLPVASSSRPWDTDSLLLINRSYRGNVSSIQTQVVAGQSNHEPVRVILFAEEPYLEEAQTFARLFRNMGTYLHVNFVLIDSLDYTADIGLWLSNKKIPAGALPWIATTDSITKYVNTYHADNVHFISPEITYESLIESGVPHLVLKKAGLSKPAIDANDPRQVSARIITPFTDGSVDTNSHNENPGYLLLILLGGMLLLERYVAMKKHL